MYSSWLLICLAVTAQVVPLEQKEDSARVASEVRRLVRQLDDDLLLRRQQAEQALIRLGPDVVSHLPPVTPRTPAEVKERLGRVRKALETALAAASAKPSVVTLAGEMSLADALQALEEQTGNRVVGYQSRGGTVNAEFENTPYWQALDQLLDQQGLTIREFGGEPDAELVVTARPDEELERFGTAVYSGVFRIHALRLEARRDLRNPSIDGLRLTIGVSWEPRIRPISLRQPLDSIRIEDDLGEVLMLDSERTALNASAETGVSAVELVLPIKLPDRQARQIRAVKGTLTALVPGSVEAFEFTELGTARDVEKRTAGVTVTFERLRKNADLHEVRMSVRYDEAANALESHRGWVFNNEAYILDAAGVKIDNLGLQETRRAANEAGVAYVFPLPAGPDGCKFVYKTPALILTLPVEYELKDIDLP